VGGGGIEASGRLIISQCYVRAAKAVIPDQIESKAFLPKRLHNMILAKLFPKDI